MARMGSSRGKKRRTKRGGVPPHVARRTEEGQDAPRPSADCVGACKRSPYAADHAPRPGEKNYWAKGYSYCQQCRAYMQGRRYVCPCVSAHHVRGRAKASGGTGSQRAIADGALRRDKIGGARVDQAVRVGTRNEVGAAYDPRKAGLHKRRPAR